MPRAALGSEHGPAPLLGQVRTCLRGIHRLALATFVPTPDFCSLLPPYTTAVASISTIASASTSAVTSTSAIAG
jgi:hypothetical protein